MVAGMLKKSIKLNLIIFSFTNSLRWDVPIGVTQTSEKSFFSRTKYSAKITYNKIFMKMRFPVGTLRWSLSKCLLKTIHTICVCTNIVWRKQKEHRCTALLFPFPQNICIKFWVCAELQYSERYPSACPWWAHRSLGILRNLILQMG